MCDMRRGRLPLWIAVLPLLVGVLSAPVAAQQLRTPSTMPARMQAAAVFVFESPDTLQMGPQLSTQLVRALAQELRGIDTVALVRLPPNHLPLAEQPSNVVPLANERNAVFALWGEYYPDGDSVSVAVHLQVIPRDRVEERDLGMTYVSEDGEFTSLPPTLQVNFAPVVAGIRDTGSAMFAPVVAYVAALSRYLAGDYAAAGQGFAAWDETERQRGGEPMTMATANLLLGNAALLAATRDGGDPDHAAAARAYTRASELVPESGAPAEHLTIARLQQYIDGGSASINDTIADLNTSEVELIESVQRDGTPQAVQNLRVFYKMANRHKYLQRKGTNDEEYTQSLNQQLGVLSRIDNRQEYVIVLRMAQPVDFLDIRGGVWSPKDAEKAFTWKDVELKGAIDQAQAYGIDFHHHAHLGGPLFGDFTLGVWYSSYTFSSETDVIRPGELARSESWAVVFPAHLGLSFAPFHHMFVSPYIAVGVGAAGAVSSITNYGPSNARLPGDDGENNKFVAALAATFGAGVNLYITRGFGISIGARYELLKFKEALYTNQQDLSGLQLLVGFSQRM
jgi:hypothetical protein